MEGDDIHSKEHMDMMVTYSYVQSFVKNGQMKMDVVFYLKSSN